MALGWYQRAFHSADNPVHSRQAIGEANTFCASRREVVELVSNTSQECALHGGCGEAQITFTCAKAAP